MMTAVDYDRLATISWLNQSSDWGEPPYTSVEECWDQLTLKEAVIFAIDDLNARYRKSVVIKCGADKYNLSDIEEMYHYLNHFREHATASPSR
jgi:hypothetical protein